VRLPNGSGVSREAPAPFCEGLTGKFRGSTLHEGFNSLKNEGYNLTHNWGHVNGESFNFYLLTLLAFYMHQILDMTDALFQQCRTRARAAYALWDELRVLFNRVLYDSWEALLHDFLAGFRSSDPPI